MVSYTELQDYINNFPDQQREIVYKEIVDSDILEKAFETNEGKVLLANSVEIIRSAITKIVVVCRDKSAEEAAKEVYPLCSEVSTAFKIVAGWANTLSAGKNHKDKILLKGD